MRLLTTAGLRPGRTTVVTTDDGGVLVSNGTHIDRHVADHVFVRV